MDTVHRTIKNGKAGGLDEIHPEVWKTRQFDDILLRHYNAVSNQNPIHGWMKGFIPPPSLKRVTSNYRSSQNLPCPATKPHRTQNRQHS